MRATQIRQVAALFAVTRPILEALLYGLMRLQEKVKHQLMIGVPGQR